MPLSTRRASRSLSDVASVSEVRHRERALRIPCGGDSLTGLLHQAEGQTGVLVIVGGPQYRAGSHRQFVLLARLLASAGFPVLRFDARGMGDSPGEFPGFEHCADDIASALDTFFSEVPGLRRVVLWGLCDGASAALLYLQARPNEVRVSGLCLLNPWVRSPASLASARSSHYYRQRVMNPAFWRKLLAGGVSPRALAEWWLNRHLARQGPKASASGGPTRFQDRMREGLSRFQGLCLLVLSGNDLTAQEFVQATAQDGAWREALASRRLARCDFREADHTFSDREAQSGLFRATLDWLHGLAEPPAAPRLT